MRKYLRLFLIYSLVSIFLNCGIYPQELSQPIAEIGNYSITAEEFQLRFQFSANFIKKGNELDSVKKNFLYSLIAEKLWALKAREKGLDTLESTRSSIESLKKLFIRDELYKQEVENKIVISEDELRHGKEKFRKKYFVNIISSVDSTEIYTIYHKLKSGEDFDSLLSTRPESINQKKYLTVTLGSFEDETAEDSVFKMQSSSYTRPLKTRLGWIIVKVTGISENEEARVEESVLMNKVYSVIKKRKENNLTDKFVSRIFADKSITADYSIFNSLLKKISERLNTLSVDVKEEKELILSEKDLNEILAELPQKMLNSEFVHFESKPTLRDFIYFLIYTGFKTNSANENVVRNTLNYYVKKFIEHEVLAQEGIKRGLNNSQVLKNDLERWEDNFLAQLLLNEIWKNISITNDELQNYYNRKYTAKIPTEQVNILEILNDNLEVFETVLNELDKGENFRDLASKYTQREYTKKSRGDFGFFPAASSGEIGKIVSKLKIGEVFGPVKLPEGYSLIKLIDRRVLADSSRALFNDQKAALKIQFKYSKFDKLIEDSTASLAAHYGILVNMNELEKVEVIPVNVFVMRFIGFGGKIAGMPAVIPIYNWIDMLTLPNNLP